MATEDTDGGSTADAGPARRRPQAILLVDDEADILESLKDLFEVCIDGVTVHCAASGAEGLRLLESHPIDLVISDYKMAAMNGLEFLTKAKALAPDVPRVLATAFPDVDIAARAINEANIQSFIMKPFDPEKVIAVVQGILDRRSADAQRSQSFARSMELFRKAGAEP